MKLPIYQVDAFAARVFEGNPAAVCPLQHWLPDALMQAIATENNLSETAFFVADGDSYAIRWFTPLTEVALCGHATLASAFVIFNRLGHAQDRITFQSPSGPLGVTRADDLLVMDFPALPPTPCALPPVLAGALNHRPSACLNADDYLLVFESAAQIRSLQVDLEALKRLDLRGVAVTARGDDCDFVSRFFAPKVGVNEDPVTGSAHTELVPYWARVFEKDQLHARQLSRRGGELFCRNQGARVQIAGHARCYLTGEIEVE